MNDALDINLNTKRKKILIIDDESIIGISSKRILEPENYEVTFHQDPNKGLEEALTGAFDLILLDLILPEMDGMEILRRIKSAGILSEVVIITGYATVQTAVEAIKLGASDYISKPFIPDELKIIINKVLDYSNIIKENISLKKELSIHKGFEGIIGDSSEMREIFSIVKRIAPTEGTVCITGESGTGKEVIAQAIHRLSTRNNQPFIACDCSSLAPTLLESELFGHVKGSFSGAISTKQGLFEMANGGTLFLDEIGNMSLEIQGKLLRVLETRRMRRVGDINERKTDFRLITASNRNLSKMVEEGNFREDLFYRLKVIPIHLPPLRERAGDIIKLSQLFLSKLKKNSEIKAVRFAPEAIRPMEKYSWPGNIRELKNIVERVAILSDSEIIGPNQLPKEIFSQQEKKISFEIPVTWNEFKKFKRKIQNEAVSEWERSFILEALGQAGGNISNAAQIVGMQRTNFHSLMRKYKLNAKSKRQI